MNGFLFIDKPIGMTSREVCNQVGKILKTKKVGHIGTLDPFASGLLIITVNKGNKAGTFLDNLAKEYVASLVLGKETSTGDIEGKITKKEEAKIYSKEEILKVFDSFIGESEQIPPMTSAVHVNGKRLYELAHQGKEIERPSKTINVYELSLEDYKNNTIIFKTFVSKGTYIRVLGEDIAKKLGTVGHLNALRRTRVGPYLVDNTMKLEDVKEVSIIGVTEVLSKIATVKKVDEKYEQDIKDGKILSIDIEVENDKLLIVNSKDEAVAMYVKENNKFVFKRGLF